MSPNAAGVPQSGGIPPVSFGGRDAAYMQERKAVLAEEQKKRDYDRSIQKITDEASAGAALKLPDYGVEIQSSVDLVDKMIGSLDGTIGEHEGFRSSVGAESMLPTMPGSDSSDFELILNQLKSKTFLAAREQLKGSGAVTDFEGIKAEDAANRMATAQSENF